MPCYEKAGLLSADSCLVPVVSDMSSSHPWVTTRVAADHLNVSERTLARWRASGLLEAGKHYRRKFPAANSPLLYQLERCERAMTDAFARDHRTLELAGAV